MASIRSQDKIGALSQASTTVSLAASTLTIGGQQYRTTTTITRTIASDVTLAACSRYQVFAVQVGGAVELRISASENSVGPSGFTAWKLVGSFYANGLASVGFGSFVNIEGTPESEWFDVTVSPSEGTFATAPDLNKCSIMRSGKNLNLHWDYISENQTGATAGVSTVYQFQPSGGLNVDSAQGQGSTSTTAARGAGTLRDATIIKSAVTMISQATPFKFCLNSADESGFMDSGNFPLNSATRLRVSADLQSVPIVGWSNTPIKDL